MSLKDVRVGELRFLRGPNIYAYKPVFRVVMDIGPYEDLPSNCFPGFVERITSWLPGLHKHGCSYGRPGGFVERLRQGTYLAHITEHVTIELQSMVGFNVAFGRARGTGIPGQYSVVAAYQEEEPARAAFETALRMVIAGMHDDPFDVEGELQRLMDVADSYRLGPSTAAIVDAARKLDIPVLRLTPTSSLVQLGYGVHQKRIRASQTSITSALSVDLCQDKSLTNRILRTVGVPVPEGRVVSSADEAWEAALEIGLPVVVKPDDGNQGKGVSVNLTDEDSVRSAFEIAYEYSSYILVEKFIEGDDYRLLVINGKMVAAARRDPALVVGDGVSTVQELVDAENRDPRRREGHASTLTRIQIDDAAKLVLKQQALSLSSTPEPGQVVRLRNNCNLSTGGTSTDVTDLVHPRNIQVAELTAQVLGLDIAGVDVMCRDIARPLAEQQGAVVEVNASPGLRMHLHPYSGQPRDVGTAVIEMLYPHKAPSRIPIISVTGTNGKTTVTRLVAHVFETGRKLVGMTTTEGIYIDKEQIVQGDCSGPASARTVLLHPRVEMAVLETARGGILREGLGFDRCKVGVVTNVSSDHLGLRGINTVEELAKVKQVVVEAVAKDGAAVLNADDQLVAEMAAACDGEVVYFAHSSGNQVLAAHVAEGGKAVFVENDAIVLATGDLKTELVELSRLPFTGQGQIQFQMENALAAAAAAWAAGANPATIARALTTFETDVRMVPGRFNLLALAERQVILDYGHNPAALKALGQAVQTLGNRRTVMLIGLPGDRRDEDLVASLKSTLCYVDEYVIYEFPERRGRADREVYDLLRPHIPEGVPYSYAASEREGVENAWGHTREGDRLIVIVDDTFGDLETLEHLAGAAIGEGEHPVDSAYREAA